jgi:hypothetical protein
VSRFSEAYERSGEVRLQRSSLKEGVKAGAVPVRKVILDPPSFLRTRPEARQPITVATILAWQHRWGDQKAEDFLAKHGVSPTILPFDLSPCTRARLADALGD